MHDGFELVERLLCGDWNTGLAVSLALPLTLCVTFDVT